MQQESHSKYLTTKMLILCYGYFFTIVNICTHVYTMYTFLMYTMSVSNVACKVVSEQGCNSLTLGADSDVDQFSNY